MPDQSLQVADDATREEVAAVQQGGDGARRLSRQGRDQPHKGWQHQWQKHRSSVNRYHSTH